MKNRLLILLLVLAAVLALGCASASAASEDPVQIKMQLSKTSFTAPEEIQVAITISNAGQKDLAGPVILYYPNGKQVEAFGTPTLAAGKSQTWTGNWGVTEDQLKAGRVTFKVEYSYTTDTNEVIKKAKSFAKTITFDGSVASCDVNRSISPVMAGKGDTVTVTYDVVNTGTVELTKVTIKENASISSKTVSLGNIKPGAKASHTFSVKMGTKNLTSEGTVSWTVNGKSDSVKKEAVVVKYGEVELTADLKADKKGGEPGSEVTLTLTLRNKGKTDYTGVTVTDPTLGVVFRGESVPAGQTKTLERKVTVSQTINYQFSVTAKNADGLEVDVNTPRVTVTAVEAGTEASLAVIAEADRDVIYQTPGKVRFTISVKNNSQADAANVTVGTGNLDLYTFPTVMAGETRSFTRDLSISMAGKYQFRARMKDQLGETKTFDSNILQIRYTSPTAEPTKVPAIAPTRAPYATPVNGDVAGVGDKTAMINVLNIGGYVLGGLAAIGAVLLIIGAIRRAAAAAKSAGAVDHLQRSGTRDYEEPLTNKQIKQALKEAEAEQAEEEAAGPSDEVMQSEWQPVEFFENSGESIELPAESQPEDKEGPEA